MQVSVWESLLHVAADGEVETRTRTNTCCCCSRCYLKQLQPASYYYYYLFSLLLLLLLLLLRKVHCNSNKRSVLPFSYQIWKTKRNERDLTTAAAFIKGGELKITEKARVFTHKSALPFWKSSKIIIIRLVLQRVFLLLASQVFFFMNEQVSFEKFSSSFVCAYDK